MNSIAIAKTNDSVAILHLHTNITKQLVFHKGDEVLINIQ